MPKDINNTMKVIDGINIVVYIDDTKHVINLAELLKIDENNLTHEYSKQAAMYAYIGYIVAKLSHIESMYDLKKDREYAIADENYRQQMDESKTKYTEAVIKSLVIVDEDYIKIVDDLAIAQHNLLMMKNIMRALEQRSDMLISLGSHLRHEANMTGMHVNYDNDVNELKDKINSMKSNKI